MKVTLTLTPNLPKCPECVREILRGLDLEHCWRATAPPTLDEVLSYKFVAGEQYIAVTVHELLEKIKAASADAYQCLEENFPHLFCPSTCAHFVIFPLTICQIKETEPDQSALAST